MTDETTIELADDDAALVVRGDGRVEVFVPKQDDEDAPMPSTSIDVLRCAVVVTADGPAADAVRLAIDAILDERRKEH
jgi:hypothetical protein